VVATSRNAHMTARGVVMAESVYESMCM
jgi:hypothetical protein